MDDMDAALQRGKDLTQQSSDALAGRELIHMVLTRIGPNGMGEKVSLDAHPDNAAEMDSLIEAFKAFTMKAYSG